MTMDLACPRCAEPVDTADQFCEGCGTDLRVRRSGTVAVAAAGTPRPCHGCGQPFAARGSLDVEYCPSCGLRRRDATDRVEIDLGALAGVSDRGQVHIRNEDATALGQRMAASPPALAAVVCDGVSTVNTPDLASRAAAEAALDLLLDAENPPEQKAEDRARAAVAAAARAVAALPAPRVGDAPCCTLVCALVNWPEPGQPEITVAWVGDSRAYWLAGADAVASAHLLTSDHSWAAEMVAAGVLDAATAMADARAHAITQWVGAGGAAEPGVLTLRPAASGVVMLCSDGLWNHLPGAEELAAVALPVIEHDTGALKAAAALTAVALERGGQDNITVVVIPITVRSPS
ncbi:MAG: protein phosphatase 2C domain-containing protein [Pseudonocardiales bacterium]|nr:protein phosphatase 2C domain-containing protein [Pseudonocardiales bacterium]